MKAIAACGSTPENVAKVIMIENQLSKKGAQSRFISDALKHLADYDAKRATVTAALTAAFAEEKLTRNDVFLSVRSAQAIENENEPTWKDVKNMKDVLQGCSPSSPEGIELNLARATKVNFSLISKCVKFAFCPRETRPDIPYLETYGIFERYIKLKGQECSLESKLLNNFTIVRKKMT